MTKVVTFDRYKTPDREIRQLHKEGYTVVCPLCKSEILFYRTGMRCSKNSNHYDVHYYIRDRAFERESKERRKQESIANMKKQGYTEVQIQEHLDKYYPEKS